MLSLQLQESPHKPGFTVIEIILVIGFLGVVISMLFSLLHTTETIADRVLRRDDALLNGRYASEYIIEDVMLADEIVSMEDYYPGNIQQEDTFGFILINENKDVNPSSKEVEDRFRYKYIYYRLTGDVIFRSTYSHNTYRPENAPSNGGNNFLIENVISIEGSKYSNDDKILYIDIETRDPVTGKDHSFMETKYLRDH